MPRPKIESAVAPIGGYRPTTRDEPSPELVRLLAEWLDTTDTAARSMLDRLR